MILGEDFFLNANFIYTDRDNSEYFDNMVNIMLEYGSQQSKIDKKASRSLVNLNFVALSVLIKSLQA